MKWARPRNPRDQKPNLLVASPSISALGSEPPDAELVVAIFRTIVILAALFLPRLVNGPVPIPTPLIWLAAVAGIYNFLVVGAYFWSGQLNLRRPFIIAMDLMLISLWIHLLSGWALFPLYYVVVVTAAMWYRIWGGLLTAFFCNFFYLLMLIRGVVAPTLGVYDSFYLLAHLPFLGTGLALNIGLLFLVGSLVGSLALAQERERARRLEEQLLLANYQREIDLATQLQPLLISPEFFGYAETNADENTADETDDSVNRVLDPTRDDFDQEPGILTDFANSPGELMALSAPPPDVSRAPKTPHSNVSGSDVSAGDNERARAGSSTRSTGNFVGDPLENRADASLVSSLTPQAPPKLMPQSRATMADRANVKLGAMMQTAREFGGGDYFDFIPLENGRSALCIADVSGKSVRAQARLPLLKYALRALAPLYSEPETLVKRLNETLAPDLQNELFIGLCYIMLDPRANRLKWCNAGHIAPLLLPAKPFDERGRALPELLALETLGPPLGPFPEIVYEGRSAAWRAGDRLLLFTDGLSDALSYRGREDGEEQVRHIARDMESAFWLEPQNVAKRFLHLAQEALDDRESLFSRLSLRLRQDDRNESSNADSPNEHSSLNTAGDRRDDITVVVARRSLPNEK